MCIPFVELTILICHMVLWHFDFICSWKFESLLQQRQTIHLLPNAINDLADIFDLWYWSYCSTRS